MEPQQPAGATARRAFPTWPVYTVLVVLGGALGVWGAFLVPLRVAGVAGFADLLAVAGNAAAAVAVGWATRNAVASACPGLGWLTAVLVVATVARPANEVVVPSRLDTDPGIGTVGTAYLFAGAAGAVVGVLIAARFTRGVQPPTSEG